MDFFALVGCLLARRASKQPTKSTMLPQAKAVSCEYPIIISTRIESYYDTPSAAAHPLRPARAGSVRREPRAAAPAGRARSGALHAAGGAARAGSAGRSAARAGCRADRHAAYPRAAGPGGALVARGAVWARPD